MKDTNFWSKYFKVYDTLNLLIPYQELLSDVVNELNAQPGEKIFEAGCGTGNLAIKIKLKGAKVIGMDNCQAALDVYKAKDGQADMLLGSLIDVLPFDDQSFDKVVLNNVLYCFTIEQQKFILSEVFRVLKNHGLIVMANPRKGWRPFKIYQTGIKLIFKKIGFIKGLIFILKLIIPTIKILYYNFYITRESDYYFFDSTEQRKMLLDAGFSSVSLPKQVYADQGLLYSGCKII